MWIFAYGSLIFRPAFPYLERRRAFLPGWSRRFWQGSPDHRGVPEAPGLVATLVAETGALCGGCAYRIDGTEAPRILAELDIREQAGFERHCLALVEAPDQVSRVSFAEAVVYVAKTDNPHFLGPLDERAIATWVRTSRGPSGANIDYVLCLHDALRALSIEDPHVETIVRWLREEIVETPSS